MNPATSGGDHAPQVTENETKPINGLVVSNQIVTAAGIPEVLRDFVVDFSQDGSVIRFKARRNDGRAAGVLIIPNIHYPAWKVEFPKALIHAPESRYEQSRCVFFAVDDLPEETTEGKEGTSDDVRVYFTGSSKSINAGAWLEKQPAELPVITYADITRLLGMPAPKSQPADPQEPAPDYSVYLSTDAAKSPLHGIYAVYPSRVPKAGHTTDKRPCGIDGQIKRGVYNFTHTAEDVMAVLSSHPRRASVVASIRSYLIRTAKTKEDADYLRNVEITLCLGRVFSADDGIMALDFDGHHPPAGISNGTGYSEVSSSGTGDHILFRTEKEQFPTGTNKIKRVIDGHEIELFYGKGNGMAISGRDATAGPIDLDTASEASKLIIRMQADAGTPNKQESITAASTTDDPAPATPTRTDDEVIYLVKKTPRGRALWSGDTSGYPSPSEADAALMVMLADITGGTRRQMERVFLLSGLAKREKSGRPDYIRRTIDSACEYVARNHHTPPVVVYEDDDEPDEPEDTYDYEAEDAAIKSLMDRAPAPLLSSVAYYNAISPVPQPLFALTSTLIAAGCVLGRNWITARMVFDCAKLEPSTLNDYFMILAETGHGKDTVKTHLRNTVPEISQPAGMSGSTALHKALQVHPRIKMLMDEAGRRIAETGSDKSGTKQGAETLAMEIYGQTGSIDPQNFAQSKDSPVLRNIERHGLVVVRTSTIDTLSEAVPLSAVNDGWLPRHIVVISKRPRPPTWGAYHPEGGGDDPINILDEGWNEWKIAHIGMPAYDTYRQAISPIRAAEWGYHAPTPVIEAADEMRSPKLSYLTTKRVVNDPPITINWETAAAEAIGKIYEETEAVPKDNYTGMRHRKVAHIIKIAGIFALLSDGITKKGLMAIRKKHTGTEAGKKTIAEESQAKDAYNAAHKAVADASKDKEGDPADVSDLVEKSNKARKQWKEKRDTAENVVWKPCRTEIAAQLQITITADAVQWARDYIDLVEGPARKLVIEELIDAGFIAGLDAVEAFLTEHDGAAAENRIIHSCKAVRALDGPHSGLNAFGDYAESTGRLKSMPSNRGRRWALPDAENPTQTAEAQEEDE